MAHHTLHPKRTAEERRRIRNLNEKLRYQARQQSLNANQRADHVVIPPDVAHFLHNWAIMGAQQPKQQ